MPELDFETKDLLHQLQEDGLITRREREVIAKLYTTPSRKEAARRLGIERGSFNHLIYKLVTDHVLIRIRKNVLVLNSDPSSIKRNASYVLPPPEEVPLVMSDAERKWMIENYDSTNRTQAAKALKRSKYDINRMALALKLDRKN
ncbi:hypothetical protein J41TS12_50250 [Paenibacillus antibioticophila]|uniref:Uncharacterized protein n=1 Tax=Paenibacillus antibioticophila TaxID=1274374 RepID=A0A920CK57_9BACL|nr:hypothetical protein [Paenibacillus antibioticophila]GIO40164.1 hypothetical protein J41TS12_50250 [Paenibacillus antibioticophila]